MIVRKIRKNGIALCIFITSFALILGGCGSSSAGDEDEPYDPPDPPDLPDPPLSYTCYDAPETNECTNPDYPRDCVEACGSLDCNFYCSTTESCYDTEYEAIADCGDDECFTCDGGDNGDDDCGAYWELCCNGSDCDSGLTCNAYGICIFGDD
jgi:hypothetical protein